MSFRSIIRSTFDNPQLGGVVSALERDFMSAFIQYETISESLLSKALRAVATPQQSNLYVPNAITANKYVDTKMWPDIKLAIMGDIACFWKSITFRNKVWRSSEEYERTVTKWIKGLNIDNQVDPMSESDYDNLMTFDVMSKFITHCVDILDLLERDMSPYSVEEGKGENKEFKPFIIDTTFMDRYGYRDGMRKCGSKAYVHLTHHGFQIYKLEYDGATYVRTSSSTEQSRIAFHAFYTCIMTYMTVCSHFTNCHYFSAYNMCLANEKLPMTSTLRKVLLPLEFNVKRTLGRANVALISKGGLLNKIFPFSDDGLKAMVTDYSAKHSSLEREFSMLNGTFLGLSDSEWECQPFASYKMWIDYFRFYMQKISPHIDPDEMKLWVETYTPNNKYKSIPETFFWTMVHTHFTEVRHRMMINISFVRSVAEYSVLIRLGHDAKKSSYTRNETFKIIFLSVGTTYEIFPMDAIPNITYASPEIQADMTAMRRNMKTVDTPIAFLRVGHLYSSVGI